MNASGSAGCEGRIMGAVIGVRNIALAQMRSVRFIYALDVGRPSRTHCGRRNAAE